MSILASIGPPVAAARPEQHNATANAGEHWMRMAFIDRALPLSPLTLRQLGQAGSAHDRDLHGEENSHNCEQRDHEEHGVSQIRTVLLIDLSMAPKRRSRLVASSRSVGA